MTVVAFTPPNPSANTLVRRKAETLADIREFQERVIGWIGSASKPWIADRYRGLSNQIAATIQMEEAELARLKAEAKAARMAAASDAEVSCWALRIRSRSSPILTAGKTATTAQSATARAISPASARATTIRFAPSVTARERPDDMRNPTTLEAKWSWWERAVSGDDPPVHEDEPQVGFYAVRKFKYGLWVQGPLVPARIWLESETDPDTGELIAPERFRAEIDGKPVNPWRKWTWLAARPISENEWKWLRAQSPLLPRTIPKKPS